jgi:hypothetical protein
VQKETQKGAGLKEGFKEKAYILKLRPFAKIFGRFHLIPGILDPLNPYHRSTFAESSATAGLIA